MHPTFTKSAEGVHIDRYILIFVTIWNKFSKEWEKVTGNLNVILKNLKKFRWNIRKSWENQCKRAKWGAFLHLLDWIQIQNVKRTVKKTVLF